MAPTTEGSATSKSVVEIIWSSVTYPHDGGSPILSYNIYWDKGVGTWVNLVGQTSDYLHLYYSVGGSIVESGLYKFMIRAKNKWGFGPFSSITSIVASGSPYKILNVTTYVSKLSGDVIVLWTTPVLNGASITSYLI